MKATSPGSGSKLLLIKLDSSLPADAKRAVEEVKASGIDHIDILIANAGIGPPISSLETVDLGEVTNIFNVNALGPLALCQACHPLLQKPGNAKFVPITSIAGSIGALETNSAHIIPSYGISKAALDWITV